MAMEYLQVGTIIIIRGSCKLVIITTTSYVFHKLNQKHEIFYNISSPVYFLIKCAKYTFINTPQSAVLGLRPFSFQQ